MTETERKHSIEALTSGAMAGIWAWVLKRQPSGVEIFDAHAHIRPDFDGRTMIADGMRERPLSAGVARGVGVRLTDGNARDDSSGSPALD